MALGEFVMVQILVGSNDTRAQAPELFGALGEPDPRHNAIGAVLAIAGALAFAILIGAFRAALGTRGARTR